MFKKQYLCSIALALLGFVPVFSVSALPLSRTNRTDIITQRSNANARQLLQEGIALYETEEFRESIDLWLEAARIFAAENDRLGEALTHSNLSLAYQHIGELDKAAASIEQSFEILENWDDLDNLTYLEIHAKASNTYGHLHWRNREIEAALASWENATRYYAEANYEPGIITSKINQSQALQALGLYRRAAQMLEEIYERIKDDENSELKAIALRDLGKAFRRIGVLMSETQGEPGSLEVLEKSLEIADRAETWLELGNTQRALADRSISFDRDESDYIDLALLSYQNAEQKTTSSMIKLQAQLNQLSWSIETGRGLENFETLRSNISQSLNTLTPNRSIVYAKLNFAWNLTCLKQSIDVDIPSCLSRDRRELLTQNSDVLAIRQTLSNRMAWEDIEQILNFAVRDAENLNDRTAQSYAIGQLGGIYELKGDLETALMFTEAALERLVNIQAPVAEIEYRWQWQLGRLLTRKSPDGELKNAIDAYENAARSLKSVRSDLLTIESDVQFSFRDDVEPLYRELLSLLLPVSTSEIDRENLKKALFYVEEIQLSELESFLRCDLGTLRIERVEDRENPYDTLLTKLDEVLDRDRNSAFIYPILFEDRVSIILKTPGSEENLIYFEGKLSDLEQPLNEIILETKDLLSEQTNRPDRGKKQLQKLYNILMRPIDRYLDEANVETLVFVLDGNLRNIPIAALHDGENYLVDRDYSIAISPAIQLLKFSEIQQSKINVLIAASSINRDSERENFPDLNFGLVERQIHGIEAILTQNEYHFTTLYNGQFTKKNLSEEMSSAPYTIVHAITHGQFTADPSESFIMTDDTIDDKSDSIDRSDYTIDLDEIGKLLQGSVQRREQPIDLLVLSSCETATGNNRAVLGIAGMTVKSGAISTLAPLWKADQESTAELMINFYTYLAAGSSKAEALHLAQQDLKEKYRSPYHWASFVLVGY
ncbi:MAG: CHAT domain-containing protein [Cyanobacteria bacterium SBC]|nr:CHAT domain-containing protein [Cyanobacteria bacterium SBC]